MVNILRFLHFCYNQKDPEKTDDNYDPRKIIIFQYSYYYIRQAQ